MKIDYIFFIVLITLMLFIFFDKKTETFADTTSAITSDQVKQMIKEIYLADIDAIRNLSNVATKLSTGGYTVPGNLNVSDAISSKSLVTDTITSKSLTTDTLSVTNNLTSKALTTDTLSVNGPISNATAVGNGNVFNTTAITTPLTINGLARGTGDSASYTTFNNAINSWYGTGFVDTCFKTCKCVINHRTGDISTQGTVSTPNPISINGVQQIIKAGTASSGSDGKAAVTFPTAFPEGYTVVVTANPKLGSGDTNMVTISINNVTTKGFAVTTVLKDGRNGQTGGGIRTIDYNWIAIGTK